jgi:hypothetical protein
LPIEVVQGGLGFLALREEFLNLGVDLAVVLEEFREGRPDLAVLHLAPGVMRGGVVRRLDRIGGLAQDGRRQDRERTPRQECRCKPAVTVASHGNTSLGHNEQVASLFYTIGRKNEQGLG